jgi:hypothetical protein
MSETKKRAPVRAWVVVALMVLLIGYPLSIGPAFWYCTEIGGVRRRLAFRFSDNWNSRLSFLGRAAFAQRSGAKAARPLPPRGSPHAASSSCFCFERFAASKR